jgi:hypothetical protein
MEQIVFRDNVICNTSGFILMETNYQDRTNAPHVDYEPAVIRNLWFGRNHQTHGTRQKAVFACAPRSCRDLVLIKNRMAVSNYDNETWSPWICCNISYLRGWSSA